MALVHTFAFNTGTGSQTITDELPAGLDLSRRKTIMVRVNLTKAITDSIDTLNIFFESRGSDGGWDQRIHFTELTASLSPTVGAPEKLYGTIRQIGDLTGDELEGEPRGSAGASDLAAGTVKDGPFPGRSVDAAGQIASWRISAVVVDADGDADFEGTVYVEVT